MNHKLQNINREIYTPYAGAAGMLLHLIGKFTMGKLKNLFCRKVSFLTAPHCQFRGVGKGMKQTYLYLWYSVFQAQQDRCDQRNHQTLNYLAEREIKGSVQLLFGFFEKLLYEVRHIRIKEEIGEKRSTVCTHGYADCLLKNTSTKHNKYVVNQKLEHVDDIIFRELFGRISVFFCLRKKDMSFPSTMYLYLRWPFFLMKHSWTNSLNLSFSLE